MSSLNGENENGLKAILDFTRLSSISVLLIHFYYYLYGAFNEWQLTHEIGDRFLISLAHTGLFQSIYYSKFLSLGLLFISLLGAKGKKNETIKARSIFLYLTQGSLLFLFSHLLLSLHQSYVLIATAYMLLTGLGYLFILTGGTLLSRLIRLRFQTDIFNEFNETFPQEERLLENEYSINLRARYNLKGRIRNSWINIINPFRGLLVIGSPGSGKSFFVIQHVIRQHIQKGFSMLIYDFKYDDLTRLAYYTLRNNKKAYQVEPQFYLIHFDDLPRSHRCNPLDPATMQDITDASESSRSILLGLNREWISRQGDFFVESPINFLTAVIWFLKKYKEGKYCTLPHVIELMQVDYDKLFSVLKTQKEIEVLINPFINAYQSNAMEQLEGQIASAKIGMARLSSPQLYWVLSGNDLTLDINDPQAPKILCLGNNPQKQQVFGAVLSLYVNRLIKLVNQKNQLKCSLVFDEFPTIFISGIDTLIATARSNKVATCLGLQDFSQLRKDYGADQASVITGIVGNIISGQVMGDTAKQLSERFGKIMQIKESISINRTDASISKSSQLDLAIPASKISSLSSGEFVGMVADNPEEKIKLKTFHASLLNDPLALKREQQAFTDLPQKAQVTQEMILANYQKIKTDITAIIEVEIETLLNTPDMFERLPRFN